MNRDRLQGTAEADYAVFWQSMPQSSPIGERALIESLRAQAACSPRSSRRGASKLTLGIGDDCAILQPPSGHEVLVTTDFSLETIHFRRDWHTPESAGHRCVARGLSDLAAMGGHPLAAFLSLSLPTELLQNKRGQPSWRERFLTGFLALADRYRVPLAGGDTAQSPLLATMAQTGALGTVNITGWALADVVLVGTAPRKRALRRSTARAGDRIYVTGSLGGAAAELAQLAASPRRFRNCTQSAAASLADKINPHPHLFPEPRLDVGAWLLKHKRATAAIDISDGLSTDLDHLCEQSGLAAQVDASSIPVHPLARAPEHLRSGKALDLALHGGEDYELLFTAPPNMRVPRRIAGVPVVCIGEMRRYSSRSPRMVLREQNAEYPLRPAGWEHYR